MKVPRSWKEILEEYCKHNGYTVSYAIRKAVEDQIISPKHPSLAEFMEKVESRLQRIERILYYFDDLFRELCPKAGIPWPGLRREEDE